MEENKEPSFSDFKEGWEGITDDGLPPEPVTTEQTDPEAPATEAPQPVSEADAAQPPAEPEAERTPQDRLDEMEERRPEGAAPQTELNPLQNLMVGAQDWVDNTFFGDQKTREEIEASALNAGERGAQERRAEMEQRYLEDPDKFVGPEDFEEGPGLVAAETVRVGAGAITQVGTSLVETVDLIGDTGLTVLGLAEDGAGNPNKNNVFSDGYEALEYNIAVAENKTAVGAFAQDALAIYLGMQLGGGLLPGLTNANRATRLGRIANEFGKGAIADLILSADGDNLSNAIEEVFPNSKDSWITALAIDEDDNPWEARIKNVLEGGIFGVAVDGVGELIGAIRKGRKAAAAARKAGKADDVVRREATEAAAEAISKPEVRPGKETREAVQENLQGTPQSPSLINPEEGAARVTSFDAQKAAKSSFEADDARFLGKVSATPILTEKGLQKIIKPNRAKQGISKAALDGLRETIVEVGSNIDVDTLSRELGQTNQETVARALVAVRNFIGDNADLDTTLKNYADGKDPLEAFKDITFTTRNGNTVAEREGVVALKTLISDTAYQINDLSANWQDIIDSGGDGYRQSEMLFDRLGALLRLHKQSSIHYAGGLQSFKIGGLKIGNSQAALSKQLEEMDDSLMRMKGLLEAGDPKSMTELRSLVTGMIVSGGDPNKIMSYWQLFRRLGGRGAMKSLYNSMLSGPLTQARNIIGNSVTTALRPMAIAMGSLLSGDVGSARIAMGAYHGLNESIWEALQVGFSSLKTGIPVNEGSKVLSTGAETAKELKLLMQQADTPAKKAAAGWMQITHDVLDSPWLSYPTRSLTAADDAFKTLIARMEMKRQVFERSFKSGGGIKFDADEFARLQDEAIGLNGEILDQKLLNLAKEGTFQTELSGNMAVISQLSESNPVFKLMMPFVKTPHNIMVYSASFMPGLNRFLKEAQAIRAGTDEVAKRELKGRVAIGYMTIAAGFGLVVGGNMTGNGPADPEENKIWRRTHQPMSIKVGGKWVSYASVEPLNMIMPIVADLAYAQQYLTRGEMDNLLGQFAWTVANATYNRSYFQGLGDAVTFFNPTNLTNGKFFQKQGAQYLNNFIPLAGPRRQLAKALSPYLYEFNNEFQRVMGNANPGQEAMGGVRRVDIFTGEEVKNAQMDGFWGVVNSFLPFSVTDADRNPVLKQLSELGVDVPTAYADSDLRSVKLDAKQRQVINKYMAEYGLQDNLQELFDKPWFKKDYEEWLAKVEAGKTNVKKEDTRWYDAIITEFRDAKKSAINRFMNEDENFRIQVREARQQDYNAGLGNYDLVNMPN